MAYADSELAEESASTSFAMRVLFPGGLGAGKTTLVRRFTEIRSLDTEELISSRPSDIEIRPAVTDQEHHHCGTGLWQDHHRRRHRAVPVRHAGPGALWSCGTSRSTARSGQ